MSAHIREISFEDGIVILDFEVVPSLASPIGFLHCGAVMTVLGACVAMEGVLKSGRVYAISLVELKTSFVRPVLAVKIFGKGETLRLGKSLAFGD